MNKKQRETELLSTNKIRSAKLLLEVRGTLVNFLFRQF